MNNGNKTYCLRFFMIKGILNSLTYAFTVHTRIPESTITEFANVRCVSLEVIHV